MASTKTAKSSAAKGKAATKSTKRAPRITDTDIDRVVTLAQQSGGVTASDVGKRLRVNVRRAGRILGLAVEAKRLRAEGERGGRRYLVA